jgi:hypothetical protein
LEKLETITKSDVIRKAADNCMKVLYSLAQPHIEWDEFVKENKNYSNRYKAWERYYELSKKESLTKEELKEFSVYPNEWKDKSLEDCIGPAPFKFYYLPRNVFEEVVNNFVYAYELDQHQQLLDTIHILKDYCEKPIVDKYIKKEDGLPEYDHPDNLKKEVTKLLNMYFHNSNCDLSAIAEDIEKVFFDFLDMAGNFFKWNGYLEAFNYTIYLGASPYTNKQEVIDNWKKYRNQTIKINDSEYDNEE